MRVNIEVPKSVIFTYSMVISKEHENVGGHFSHDKVVTVIGDCRDAWFTSMGFTNCAIGRVGIVNTDLMVMYMAEAFHNEELDIHLGLADINKYGGDMMLQAVRRHDKKEVFRSKSGFVFFDYDIREVVERLAQFNEGAGLLS